MPTLSPASTMRNTLRKLTEKDPHQHAVGRNYRVSAEIEPNTPETATLRIKLSSIAGPSFAIGTTIPCPRDALKSHVIALADEAATHGFTLAESKDTLRNKAADFLEANPPPKPEKVVRGPVETHAKGPKPKRVAKTPTGKKELPKPEEAALQTTTIQSAAELPPAMVPLYAALSQVQKPYVLSSISLNTENGSRQCSVFVSFKMQNGVKVSRLVTIPNATMESSVAGGMVVKDSVAANILSTIQYATKVPQEALWGLITGDKLTKYSTPSNGPHTNR